MWRAVASGAKPYEVRRNDRDFAVGDVLLLCEWEPYERGYTGQRLTATVSHVLSGERWGLQAEFVVMGLRDVSVA
jgi:hypothetical protein